MKKEEQTVSIIEMKKMVNEFSKIITQFKELELGKIHMKFSENVELIIEEKPTQVIATQTVQAQQVSAPAPTASTAEVTPNNETKNEQIVGHPVKAPLVGTFYESAAPGEKPFVSVGQTVAVGDVLCIVESMKVMNEIKSNKAGKIKSINVDNEQLVEFDQVLFVIE